MYFCNMENNSTFIQLSFNTDDEFKNRYLVIAEVVEQEVQYIHLVPVPAWLVYYSKTYRYCCINLN